jgi:hypothetical protein
VNARRERSRETLGTTAPRDAHRAHTLDSARRKRAAAARAQQRHCPSLRVRAPHTAALPALHCRGTHAVANPLSCLLRSRRFAPPRLTRTPRAARRAQLTLVGKIINVNDTATQILYRIDDGTGAREARTRAHKKTQSGISTRADATRRCTPRRAGKVELKLWVDNDDPDASAAARTRTPTLTHPPHEALCFSLTRSHADALPPLSLSLAPLLAIRS